MTPSPLIDCSGAWEIQSKHNITVKDPVKGLKYKDVTQGDISAYNVALADATNISAMPTEQEVNSVGKIFDLSAGSKP